MLAVPAGAKTASSVASARVEPCHSRVAGALRPTALPRSSTISDVTPPERSGAVVIMGFGVRGKWLWAERFAAHYGCERIIDDWQLPRAFVPGDRDLILSTRSRRGAAKRFASAQIVSVTEARAAIGLTPTPAKADRP